MRQLNIMIRVLIVVVALSLAMLAHAAEVPLWIVAEGESYQGDADTLKEVRDRAKRDAETRAIENAVGTFIKSHTLVSNHQIAEDLVYAAVRGKITKEEIISSGWDAANRNLYRVKIKALVAPIHREKGNENGESLEAKISLSRADLREGDEVQIYYQVNRDSYVYLFSIAADGSVTLLLPNSKTADHFVQGGTVHQFPSDTGIRLRAMLLPGTDKGEAEEKIKVIATRQKDDLLPLGFREGTFQVYDARSTGMISDLVRRLNQMEPTDWTEATAVYTIRR